MIHPNIQPGLLGGGLGSQPSPGFDEIWEMPNAVVDTKIDIYDRAGEELAGTFDASKLIDISTTKQLFSGNEPTVGNAISGEIDIEFYPVEAFGGEVTVNPAYTQSLGEGTLTDLEVSGTRLVIKEV